MKHIPIPTGALLAGTAFVSLPSASSVASRDMPPLAPIGIVSSVSLHAATEADSDESPSLNLARVPASQEWNSKLERRFLRLAEREAVGRLASQERAELEDLAALRSRLKVPRRGEEVMNEFQQRQLTNDLLLALQRYVHFHKTAHR